MLDMGSGPLLISARLSATTSPYAT